MANQAFHQRFPHMTKVLRLLSGRHSDDELPLAHAVRRSLGMQRGGGPTAPLARLYKPKLRGGK